MKVMKTRKFEEFEKTFDTYKIREILEMGIEWTLYKCEPFKPNEFSSGPEGFTVVFRREIKN